MAVGDPPDIYGALVKYTQANIPTLPAQSVWLNYEPESTTTTNRQLPYVVITGAFKTTWTLSTLIYYDAGTVRYSVFTEGCDQAREIAEQIMALYRASDSWEGIPIEDGQIFEVSRSGYELTQAEMKSRNAQPVAQYDIDFKVQASNEIAGD